MKRPLNVPDVILCPRYGLNSLHQAWVGDFSGFVEFNRHAPQPHRAARFNPRFDADNIGDSDETLPVGDDDLLAIPDSVQTSSETARGLVSHNSLSIWQTLHISSLLGGTDDIDFWHIVGLVGKQLLNESGSPPAPAQLLLLMSHEKISPAWPHAARSCPAAAALAWRGG